MRPTRYFALALVCLVIGCASALAQTWDPFYRLSTTQSCGTTRAIDQLTQTWDSFYRPSTTQSCRTNRAMDQLAQTWDPYHRPSTLKVHTIQIPGPAPVQLKQSSDPNTIRIVESSDQPAISGNGERVPEGAPRPPYETGGDAGIAMQAGGLNAYLQSDAYIPLTSVSTGWGPAWLPLTDAAAREYEASQMYGDGWDPGCGGCGDEWAGFCDCRDSGWDCPCFCLSTFHWPGLEKRHRVCPKCHRRKHSSR